MRRALVVLLALAVPATADEPKPPSLSPEAKAVVNKARTTAGLGVQFYRDGRPADGAAKLRQALAMFQSAYPADRFPDGHTDLATCLNLLAIVVQAAGQPDDALPFHEQCLAMRRKLYPESRFPTGHPDVAGALNNVGFARQDMGQPEKALPFFEQALAMNRTLYPAAKHPDGHNELATSLNNVGFALVNMGQAERALPYYEQSVAMTRRLFPAAKYPAGHLDLATGISNLAGLYQTMGQLDRALPLHEQALAMTRALYPTATYPDGHPELSANIANLAAGLAAAGQHEPAAAAYAEALGMARKLYPAAKYPRGHPLLAAALGSAGRAQVETGRPQAAVALHDEALAMVQRLYPAAQYPAGHPDIAGGLRQLGLALTVAGQPGPGLERLEQGLAMNRRLFPPDLYPLGHPDLAGALDDVALALHGAGQLDRALAVHAECLAMHHRLLRRELLTAPESAALDRLPALAGLRDRYLSLAGERRVTAADCYAVAWPLRSVVTRVLERRHADARAAGTAAAARLDQLRDNRRRTERLLQAEPPPADRDRRLAALADEREALERDLAATVPTLRRWQELDRLGPADLARALPDGAAFIDLIAYTRRTIAPRTEGRPAEKRVPGYAAFVVGPGDAAVRRVDLDDAGAIDAAVGAWRADIEAGRASAAAGRVARLVWEPLAKQLPAGTRVVYLAADGDLARLPWAALPVGSGRVLLEDHAVAVVPHGAFLLDRLTAARPPAAGAALLTLGGVAYRSARWPQLPGTAREIDAVGRVAPAAPTTLTGPGATADRLTRLLPTMTHVHLATHGEFQADALTAERKRAAAALASRQAGAESRPVAAKNPLGYVGLVLANGEVLSGLSIVDLPLENLKLVTLSACETGLGESTGGEGVQGLQRAFHLAGSPNVVASLWKVDDAATAALMAKFYHELWVAKRPPIEALRQAQLTIYRHPELIPDLAGERGAPRLKQAAAGEPPASAGGGRRADTRLWAAFVLSGVGQ